MLWYLSGLALAGALVYTLTKIRIPEQDQWLDAALEANRYKYRPGMDQPDYAILNRVGSKRWAEATDAQRRLQR